MRQLKKAQKTDKLRQSMRAADGVSGWKTPAKVFEHASGVWRDSDPRVLSVLVSWTCSGVRGDARDSY